MSRYFASDGDTCGDIVWRHRPHPSVTGRYIMYVGDKPVGELWHMHNGWMAIANARKEKLLGLRAVEGFRTRRAASEYILNVGFRQKEKDQ